MVNGLDILYDLYKKANEYAILFSDLPEKDIRRKHMEIFQSQITITYINLKINVQFIESSEQNFLEIFSHDKSKAHSYCNNLLQNLKQNLIDSFLFQTELVFRYYYSKLKDNIPPGKEKNINKIFATLYDDIENNWQKDETNFLVLFWTLRNTIHTGGIYFLKNERRSLTYKKDEYIFEYGKSPDFLKNNFTVTLISDLMETLKILFESEKIKNLGYIEHPTYFALEK